MKEYEIEEIKSILREHSGDIERNFTRLNSQNVKIKEIDLKLEKLILKLGIKT